MLLWVQPLRIWRGELEHLKEDKVGDLKYVLGSLYDGEPPRVSYDGLAMS